MRMALLFVAALLFGATAFLFLRTGHVPFVGFMMAAFCFAVFLFTGASRPRGGRAAGGEDQGE